MAAGVFFGDEAMQRWLGGFTVVWMLGASAGGWAEEGKTAPVFAVDGMEVTADEVVREVVKEMTVAKKKENPPEEKLRAVALELAKTKLMAKEAEGRGLEKLPSAQEQIEASRRAVLAGFLRLDERYKIEIPDMEASAHDYYDLHKDEFRREEKIAASHIFFTMGCDAASSDCLAAALAKREKAEEVLRRLKAGQDFASLAREYSEDERSAKSGGNLGALLKRSEVEPEFAAVAFALEPGQISEVVQTKFGYHIIRLDNKLSGKSKSFEEVHPLLIARLKRDYVKQRMLEVESGYAKKAAAGQWNEEEVQRLVARLSKPSPKRPDEKPDAVDVDTENSGPK
jgi:parvulin-like peptidyl-prolyl isomerase